LQALAANSQLLVYFYISFVQMSKRNAEEKQDSSSDSEADDDFGPMPVSVSKDTQPLDGDSSHTKKKRAKKLEFEHVYSSNLPSAQMYEHSFMHRDIVTHVVVSKATDFVVTGSADGHVKFWKKMAENIEFVKHFQAHLGPIHAFELSLDEKRLLTTSQDRMVKFFELLSYDITNMIAVPYIPTAACWLPSRIGIRTRVAVADLSSECVRLYSCEGGGEVLSEVRLHASPVRCAAPLQPIFTRKSFCLV
jgi:peptidylprolyl isomerase domain and WD repeat-containing protein 1